MMFEIELKNEIEMKIVSRLLKYIRFGVVKGSLGSLFWVWVREFFTLI